ncbi:MAG: PPC domain-containing protein [Spirochaetales bacterium]|nr:PPC domain-containing protein [Spirochaetales bacterium]
MMVKRFGYGVMLAVRALLSPAGAAPQEVLFSSSGSLGSGDAVSPDGVFQDVYEIRVEAGRAIEVIARSNEVDTYIDAVLPGGEVISNDDYDGLNAGFMTTISRTGTMRLTVSPLFGGSGGGYELIVTAAVEPEPISVGAVINGRLGDKTGRPADRFALSGTAGQRVVIELDSDDFDAYLRAMDDSGRTFSNDDGGAEGFNSRLAYTFEAAGTLTITASSFGGGAGAYELRVIESTQTVSRRYDGALDGRSDTRGYDGTLYDVYEFAGSAGRSVSILLESDDFDTVLYINNADGTNLARNDDDGGDGNSLIDVTLPRTETYRIYVTPFFDGEGTYRLTIFE